MADADLKDSLMHLPQILEPKMGQVEIFPSYSGFRFGNENLFLSETSYICF